MYTEQQIEAVKIMHEATLAVFLASQDVIKHPESNAMERARKFQYCASKAIHDAFNPSFRASDRS
jgi:hypothetical protein